MAKTGFDPRAEGTPFRYFRIRPCRIQAWREANELDGRDLMQTAPGSVHAEDPAGRSPPYRWP